MGHTNSSHYHARALFCPAEAGGQRRGCAGAEMEGVIQRFEERGLARFFGGRGLITEIIRRRIADFFFRFQFFG